MTLTKDPRLELTKDQYVKKKTNIQVPRLEHSSKPYLKLK